MRQALFVLFVLAISLTACRKKAETTTFSEPLRMRITELPDSAGRTLRLTFYTVKEYPCANFRINAELRFKDRHMQILFWDIDESGVCATAIRPASVSIDYRDLAPGNYKLSLLTKAEITDGELRVSSERFDFELLGSQLITPKRIILNRIPENTIFGTINYPDSATAATVKTFMDGLQNLGAKQQRFLPGTYDNFEVDTDGRIVQMGRMGSHYAVSFIYHYDGPDSRLRDYVRDFAFTAPMAVRVGNAKGQWFYNSK